VASGSTDSAHGADEPVCRGLESATIGRAQLGEILVDMLAAESIGIEAAVKVQDVVAEFTDVAMMRCRGEAVLAHGIAGSGAVMRCGIGQRCSHAAYDAT
jgi:hypothetical protein